MNSKASSIRANFENLAKEQQQEDKKKAEAERAQRMAQEKQEQEEARRKLEVSEIQIPIVQILVDFELSMRKGNTCPPKQGCSATEGGRGYIVHRPHQHEP